MYTSIGLVVVLAGATFPGVPEPPSEKPRWHGEVAAAQAEARRTQRPILAVLH